MIRLKSGCISVDAIFRNKDSKKLEIKSESGGNSKNSVNLDIQMMILDDFCCGVLHMFKLGFRSVRKKIIKYRGCISQNRTYVCTIVGL